MSQLFAKNEFAPIPTQSFFTSNNNILFLIVIALISVGIVVAILYIVRAFLHTKSRADKAFNRVVLQILVPKERKSEGQGGQVGGEDRLEQVKEEIGITETFFAAIAGLKAQRGIKKWLHGRDDHFSFEMVAHENLIYFYIDIPKKMQQFIEQQIHGQYPYAEIDIMTDYNIFSETSSIIGAYLVPTQKGFFPFKSYKTMESDPLGGILNALAKAEADNSALAIQFVARSAHKKWRRKGIQVVREVKKGKRFESVANRSTTMKVLESVGNITGDMFKSATGTEEKNKFDKKDTDYKLSGMEEDMLKGIEEKLSKGGMDVTIRLL